MNRYRSPGAFRMALDQRLNATARERGMVPMRLRKMVTFDRLLARLLTVAPDRWLLKGGVALAFRLQEHARMTLDLDLAVLHGLTTMIADIRAAVATDLDDYFSFFAESVPVPPAVADTAASFHVIAEVGLDPDVAAGHRCAAAVLDPVLSEKVDHARWRPGELRWLERE